MIFCDVRIPVDRKKKKKKTALRISGFNPQKTVTSKQLAILLFFLKNIYSFIRTIMVIVIMVMTEIIILTILIILLVD